MLTAEVAREYIEYRPETGEFFWKKSSNPNRIKPGDIAGGRRKDGYWGVYIFGKHYLGHRMAWLIMTGKWPKEDLDHINLDRFDDRWGNLREASRSQNRCNIRVHKNNRSGFKGVSSHKSGGWVACIKKDRKEYYLGYFKTPEEAHAIYCEAVKRLHGEFARAS